MSSADKGRYQSRLFNFFHKQSRRFSERFGRSLRQLQVATSWSIEALAKSIYLVLQKAVDSANNQLPSTAEPSLQLQPSKPPVAPETAIVRVLENVEITTKKDKINSLKLSSQEVRGIASQIYSQNLVLVTNNNEILDILTPSQQQALENTIIAEVANYWRSWRLSQVNKKTKLLSRFEGFLQKIAPANVSERRVIAGKKSTEKQYNNLQINPATLASLDTAVAKLETNTLVPISKAQIVVKQRGGEIIKVVGDKLKIFLYGNGEVTVNSKPVVGDNNLETQKSRIQSLISAALNYFYGEPQGKKINQNPPTRYLSSTVSTTSEFLVTKQSKDDWLSLKDLFGNKSRQANLENQESNQLEANNKYFSNVKLPNWRTLKLKEKAGLQQPQNSLNRSSHAKKKTAITATSKLKSQNKGEIVPNQTNKSTEVEAKPEWIETKAEIVGYQKHPLEQILAWIDSAMLKIEEVFVKFANAFQQLWK